MTQCRNLADIALVAGKAGVVLPRAEQPAGVPRQLQTVQRALRGFQPCLRFGQGGRLRHLTAGCVQPRLQGIGSSVQIPRQRGGTRLGGAGKCFCRAARCGDLIRQGGKQGALGLPGALHLRLQPVDTRRGAVGGERRVPICKLRDQRFVRIAEGVQRGGALQRQEQVGVCVPGEQCRRGVDHVRDTA